MFLQESLSGLADLEWVEQGAFEPDETANRDLCGFILALALVHSDIKNIFLIQSTLRELQPAGQTIVDGTLQPQKEHGEFSGLLGFTNRQHISILHELFKLISKNEKVLHDPLSQRILRQTDRASKESWNSLVDAALHESGEFSRAIVLIRNKIGSHYDADQILAGYEYFFEKRGLTDKAFLSRGRKFSESRFYFADAAAESYMCFRSGSNDLQLLFRSVEDHTGKLFLALEAIVISFLTIKVGGFKRFG